ncbi:MAG: hypothetical protein CM1200mP35_08130 [Chloroflexota bacterium]|nr:MAG: hypothetical protein CM1200mP35_08130 [Chloroflexota bacterium]
MDCGPSVLIFAPTYSEYQGACKLMGAAIHEFCAEEIKGSSGIYPKLVIRFEYPRTKISFSL